ncbi:potassium transporter TrkG [Sulfitobacter sp. D35]|uniref:TrkH family potassium uptake protein n=1 Tax=Sulfitobacter sp. D35 TaxID=3083252 RepID=UPI00296F4712|nr:potassium transporter TrkG [Sulfitobacter sp. D35]MDW4497792.1 potassium transporter TrkG [Sulfitobacter sp. D35]
MARRGHTLTRPAGFAQSLRDLPLFLLILGIASASMLVPAVYGGVARDLEAARAFFYTGLLGLVVFLLVAIAYSGRRPRHGALGPVVSLSATFVVLPVVLAMPFHEGAQTTTFLNAYLEMVSALTTTGATVFDDPGRLPNTLHLWRALVGWMGGLLMWIAASAILAPLNLGGFEVTAQAEPGSKETLFHFVERADPRARLLRSVGALLPIYLVLTVILWVLLYIGGDRSFVALCHAMSVMATSGISPVGGMTGSTSGIPGEMVMFLFMLFALSRLTFSSDTVTATQGGLGTDPEFRIGLLIVFGVPLVLFLRHFIGAFEVSTEENLGQALQALWGSVFTVMSFLTTTGFASEHWVQSQSWSGLATPGLILLGLSVIGGGVATTAGGVKLLRVFALYLNGRREMERLIHPNSVSGAGIVERRVQRDGAFIAWIFFMLFALTLTLITVTLAILGVSFENALVMSIAGLSTTGPLIEMAADAPIRLGELSASAKIVFCAAMVLGRLETLAVIALLTPNLWRN